MRFDVFVEDVPESSRFLLNIGVCQPFVVYLLQLAGEIIRVGQVTAGSFVLRDRSQTPVE